MGVHPAKSPLNESMHDDMEPQDCALAPVVTKHTALVDEDHEMEHALSASPNISFFVVNARCAPLTPSRKRRLREADQPPSANKAPRLLDSWKRRERGDSDADSDEDICRRSPRSLQFALPGLSSSETLYLLGELVSAHHELTWLNDTHPSNAPVHPVFGWRTALWSLPTPEGHDVAVRKSAKAFEWVSARAIACAMWSWQGSNNLPELEAPRQVYTVNDGIRIVHQHDTLHGRASQSSLWLEYLCEDEDSAYIVRKELHSFQDTIYAAEPKSERECQGYIFRPLFVPLSGGIVSGTALHSISTFQTRGQLVEDTMQFMVDDMPRFVLQWEESFLQSVLPIKV